MPVGLSKTPTPPSSRQRYSERISCSCTPYGGNGKPNGCSSAHGFGCFVAAAGSAAAATTARFLDCAPVVGSTRGASGARTGTAATAGAAVSASMSS